MTDTLRDLVELAIVVDPMFDQNCYVLRRRDTTDALVVDPGLQHQQALALLEKRGLRCDRILLTHGHPDHVSGVPAIKAAFACEAAIHPDDREQLEAVHYLPGVPDDLPDIVCEQDLLDGALLRWHDQILANAEQLAVLLTIEQGKPLAEARGEIAYSAAFVRFFGEHPVRSK